jgi:AcrR family transcriptional regulator
MTSAPSRPPLTPRKRPSQRRSEATVDAILEAAVRILAAGGPGAASARRIAEVAGVSVGSLYQYFPNREAVLAELVRRRADAVAGAVSAACEGASGDPGEAARAVVAAFVAEKRRELPRSRAHALVLSLVDGRRVLAEAARRVEGAFAAMLERASGRPLAPAERARVGVALAAVEGAVAATLETDPDRIADPEFDAALVRILLGALDLR